MATTIIKLLNIIDETISFINNYKRNTKPLAVVTGTSKGIGLSAAIKLIDLGYIVAGCARSKSKMTELQTKYKTCDFSTIDISDPLQVEQWSKRIISKYGSPTLLINNAGIGAPLALIENVSDNDIHNIMNINTLGVMYVIKYFMQSMKQNANIQSKVIAISSPSGRVGTATMSPYCTSKWAIEGLMLSISKEIPKHITAFAYNPGGIITEIMYYMIPELKGKIDMCIKMGAIGPKQWADVCIPHIIGLKREDANGKQVDRPDFQRLLSNNWNVYRQVKQKVLDMQY
eukprot:352506_1